MTDSNLTKPTIYFNSGFFPVKPNKFPFNFCSTLFRRVSLFTALQCALKTFTDTNCPLIPNTELKKFQMSSFQTSDVDWVCHFQIVPYKINILQIAMKKGHVSIRHQLYHWAIS